MKNVMRIFRYALVTLAFTMIASSSFAARPSYFSDLREIRSSKLEPFPKWTNVLSRFSNQSEWPDGACGQQRFHPCRVKEWKELLESLRERPIKRQLEEINSYINEYPYVIDQVNWNMVDYWETPYEHISIGGDCEDFAIAKFYSLRYLGIPNDKLRVIIVQDFNLGGIIHAILGVYADGDLFLLDNQIKQVVSARRVYHYKPIYSVNEEAWWSYQVN